VGALPLKETAKMRERRYDIDWLRVIAMMAVFVFHCTRFFDTEGWHLKNLEQSEVLFIAMRGLIWPWVMELFFLVSGVGSWYALQSMPSGRYLWNRVKRLLIPLYTAGFLILLPPQFYFEILTNAEYRGNFWGIMPRYFAGFETPGLTSNAADLLPIPFSGHLWFLQYLFLISLMTLPLLFYLKSERGQHWITRFARLCDFRGGIFLFVIPLALVLLGLRWHFGSQRSWPDFLWYAIYFVIGYVIAADQRFTSAFRKHQWACMVLWLVGFFAGIGSLVLVLGYKIPPGHQPFSLMYVLFQIIWSISSWSAVVFMLSIGARHLNFNNKVLAYSTEAVLPFYLFHQTVILAVGLFVIHWEMGILPKFLIIAVISFPLILALYELLVKRFNIVRLLFGMMPKKQPAALGVSQGGAVS
jgi:glucans biosynthesis protein C